MKINISIKDCRTRSFFYGILVFLCLFHAVSRSDAAESYVSEQKVKGFFPLVAEGKAVALCLSAQDYQGVLRVAGHLQTDIQKVTGINPALLRDRTEGKKIVIIGTIGKNPVIDNLIAENKINAKEITGRWDTYALQTVNNPMPGVDQALVICGSNKRGTIYGMYDLSSKIGVSPWYWWADSPILKKENIFIKPGFYSPGEPRVKYRGIFINDEAPALRNWAKEKFGGFNHKFYDKVFELILRNKGNYLWPAMWVPSAFNDDDAENPRLADEYGIVMSTTHHEPMMRAHDEWYRFKGGRWNYKTNKEKLQEFWRKGFERTVEYENVVTVGMRGDGDERMTEETAVGLLQNIIADQRKIISDVTGRPAEETPQVWALYKEVQDYYDKGMRVDDDIMILFCDDNWGNLRILPKKEDLNHKGGYGIYYHFDFVGGPVSYRWLNVTQIERVWEQMNLAYRWGVEDLWIVNVGDIKPMELPISFFLDFAWNPDAIEHTDLPDYYINWSKQQFGDYLSEDIAEILSLYTKYNARRTPEMLKPETYSLSNYREADRIVAEYTRLREKAQKICEQLPDSHKAAFYQLVLFPVEACCNINEMVVAAAKNKFYAELGFAAANHYADKVIEFFNHDAELTRRYHEDLNSGRWNHMMSQTHIGYTSWNNPPVNRMPAVSYVQAPGTGELAFLIEDGFPFRGRAGSSLPLFDSVNKQNFYIDLLNRGVEVFKYDIQANEDWIILSSDQGNIEIKERVYVSIDWDKAPEGRSEGKLIISCTGKEHVIKVPIHKKTFKGHGFVENHGVISIEAAHFDKAENKNGIDWITIPNLGRTLSSVTVAPADADQQKALKDAPHLEYAFSNFKNTDLKVDTYLAPTLNFKKNEGLKYAIAIDDEKPQIINMHEGETVPDWEYPQWWNNSVSDHIKIKQSVHKSVKAGRHVLKVWMIDPGVVFQKFVIDAGGLKPSYLGPPESVYLNQKD